jgi:phage terminase Nu1 subunit (DNA packaging protein)
VKRLSEWEENKKRTAMFFGVSPQSLDGWVSRGCPCERRGRALMFYLPEVVAWRDARRAPDDDLDLTAERARLAKEQADKTEMENKRIRGESVPAAHAVTMLEKIITAFRSKVLSIPTKAAPLVHGCKNLAETRDQIEAALFDALNELANIDILHLSTAKGGGDGAPAAKTDSQPVGRSRKKAKPGGKRRAGPVAD